MLLNLLFQDPVIFLAIVAAIIVAISVHEFAHAAASAFLGDMTAKMAGRLTLNPMSHLSLLGTIMLLIAGFGWGKPVPFNPYNLKYKKWGPSLVAIAGPASNVILLLLGGITLKILLAYQIVTQANLLIYFLEYLVIINAMLALFNLLPIPPLDGSKLLFSVLDSPKYDKLRFWLTTRGPLFLLFLIIADSWLGFNIFGRLFGGVINFVYKIFF